MTDFVDASGVEHDLDAEQAAFEQRNWNFQVHRPVPAGPPDPRFKRQFLAQAWKQGTTQRFQVDGDTEDEARAGLLNLMFAEVPITDR